MSFYYRREVTLTFAMRDAVYYDPRLNYSPSEGHLYTKKKNIRHETYCVLYSFISFPYDYYYYYYCNDDDEVKKKKQCFFN